MIYDCFLTQEGFIKVDHDYCVNAARVAKQQGCQQFHVISTSKADPNSSFLYTRVKVCFFICYVILDNCIILAFLIIVLLIAYRNHCIMSPNRSYHPNVKQTLQITLGTRMVTYSSYFLMHSYKRYQFELIIVYGGSMITVKHNYELCIMIIA